MPSRRRRASPPTRWDPLPLGTYRVTTSNAVPGQTFVHEVFDNIPCTPACNVAAGTDVVLQTLNETKTANFELIQERFITGRITNALTGAGVNGVQVSVFNAAGNFVVGATTETARGVTGRYRTALQLAAGGPYYVRTTGGASMGFNDQVYGGPTCSPTCTVTSGTPITVVAFQQVENVNIALSQGSARFERHRHVRRHGPWRRHCQGPEHVWRRGHFHGDEQRSRFAWNLHHVGAADARAVLHRHIRCERARIPGPVAQRGRLHAQLPADGRHAGITDNRRRDHQLLASAAEQGHGDCDQPVRSAGGRDECRSRTRRRWRTSPQW